MTGRTATAAFGAAFCVMSLAASPSQAESKAACAPELGQAAEAIERALQKHGGDVHACFAKVLADRLDSAGRVEVAVEVGKGGKVKAAKVQKVDKSAGPVLASCIEKAAQGWIIDGIEPGAKVVLPFAFKPQGNQYVIRVADVPERPLGAPATKKGRTGSRRGAPFTVKILADEQNVKAQGISLTLLSVGPASRVAMHRHPHSAKILYLVKGHSRLLGPEGVAPLKMEEGSAVYVPAGYPHVIENMGRQSTGVFLQAFSPPGPERVYRDPKDPRGRAEFEVIRDPAAAKPTNGKMVYATTADAKPAALPKDAGTVKTLVAGGGMSLQVYELADGAELQGKTPATLAYYFVAGGGSLKVGAEAMPLAAESLVHLPRGTAYAIKAAAANKNEKITVLKFAVSGPAAPAALAPRR
ncbi:MAG: AgmX/PglI C-terminal domain-containing protein [Deltaproteobacteria bacterium]|nr:AgmX/PglI C-terminal domain-containing protein [Deltaproteobacteria bacterium]